jgi:hypothetical protein
VRLIIPASMDSHRLRNPTHAMIDEHSSKIQVSGLQREMQQSQLGNILGIHICAILDE